MSMSDCSCEDMIRQGIMRRIKKIIPKEQLSDFNYDALIFNRLDRIRDEIAGIRDSGKTGNPSVFPCPSYEPSGPYCFQGY